MADGVYNGMPASELPDLQWRLAGSADAGVEMARLPDGQIAVRNAADPAGPALIYTKAEIEALIGGAQDGDFDALLRLSPGGTTPRTPRCPRWRADEGAVCTWAGDRASVYSPMSGLARGRTVGPSRRPILWGDDPAPDPALARGRAVRGCGG